MSTLDQRKALAATERPRAASYSWCLRCGRPWCFAGYHTTWEPGVVGSFPLCEECWGELAPAARLPFYRELWWSWLWLVVTEWRCWLRWPPHREILRLIRRWPRMRQAVLEGK